MRIADFVRKSNERINLLYNNLSRKWRPNGECAGFRPRFPLDQKFCSESPEIANIRASGKAFWGISGAKKGNLARFAQILDNFSPGISVTVLFDFLEPGIFGLSSSNFGKSAYFGISGNFARKFPYLIRYAKMATFKLIRIQNSLSNLVRDNKFFTIFSQTKLMALF